MKLYDSVGPNPHVVRMVLAEKGIEVPKQRINLRDRENRQGDYLAINPMGELPALELDDGTVLTQITAIAEYIDETHPSPPLIGTTAVERAQTRKWVRWVDLNVLEPLTAGYRYSDGLEFFRDRVILIPEAADGLKSITRHWLGWLDGQMAGQPFVAGERFTLADITLFCFTRFGSKVGQPLDPAWTNLAAWYARVAERPSARA
ncbi:glutathione S-transferase family protein [Acidisphaera sp. L21]|uniref:glutathione S-transferase family protein n=1 Tax=Acidisphaera sp. L21 TaxID=1641851 RepID=UPI00131DCB0F|nr:glutathione S-transferase family protein [Acidisphaera sp. L21]